MNKVFLDTNVLVSAIDTTRVNHKKAIWLIEKIRKKEIQAFISTQIIGEFYVVLTKNIGGVKSPLSPDEAKREIKEMLTSEIFVVLPITEAIMRRSVVLASQRNIKGVKFWDVVIIACLKEVAEK
jgi:predicted nucleic acid-binding protein